ncbi:hypothetical protein Tsp_07877 [Trichinella spiralis]|uniref:hypothetical protein n=1 Tax=Trichinella spiralis TaxID=6334 RepID=UPI0001EFB278|nr:hypothetical protein Tsp_07877 [Trichinella spiralis]
MKANKFALQAIKPFTTATNHKSQYRHLSELRQQNANIDFSLQCVKLYKCFWIEKGTSKKHDKLRKLRRKLFENFRKVNFCCHKLKNATAIHLDRLDCSANQLQQASPQTNCECKCCQPINPFLYTHTNTLYNNYG